MRFGLVLLLAAAVFAVVPSASLAIRFADTPCVESGTSRVCPAGVVGSPYAIRLNGEGGCGPALPYQYRVLNGSLPPGLALDKDGLLHGTPATAGTWSFWVELSDEDPPSAAWCRPVKSEREFIVTVAAQPATVGSAYAVQVSADGVGALGVVGRLGNASTGPRTESNHGHDRWARLRSPARSRSSSRRQTLAASRPLWTSRSSRVSEAGARDDTTGPRQSRPVIPSACESERDRAARDLHRSRSVVCPIGMRLNTKTGVLSGKPHKSGTYRVTIEAQDGLRRTARHTYILTVRPLAPRRA